MATVRSAQSGLSVAYLVTQRVKRLPKGRPFSIRAFANLGTPSAVAKAIDQLVRRGELERVYRGIYMRPKYNRYVGRVRAGARSILKVICKQNRWVLQIHGANAVRGFGLSTQVPMIEIFYTSRRSRSIFVGKSEARLVHAAPWVMQRAGTKVGMAISALFYLGRDGSTPKSVAAIKRELGPEELAILMDCNMPKWAQLALEA